MNATLYFYHYFDTAVFEVDIFMLQPLSVTYIAVSSNITSHMLKCIYKHIELCNFPVNITTPVLHIHIKHTFQVFIALSHFFTPNLHAAHTH